MVAQKYDIMVGIGCGYPDQDSGKRSHTYRLPIDTVRFIAGAEDERRKIANDEKGALLLADLNVDIRRVGHRRKILQNILNVLGINDRWDIISQTELRKDKEELPKPTLSDLVETNNAAYFIEELIDRELLLKPNGTKVGWALGRKRGEIYGGECHFDREIKLNWPDMTKFVYREPGVLLARDNGLYKPPYLSRMDEVERRLLLVKNPEEIPGELEKLRKYQPCEEATIAIQQFCLLSGVSTTRGSNYKQAVEEALLRYTTSTQQA